MHALDHGGEPSCHVQNNECGRERGGEARAEVAVAACNKSFDDERTSLATHCLAAELRHAWLHGFRTGTRARLAFWPLAPKPSEALEPTRGLWGRAAPTRSRGPLRVSRPHPSSPRRMSHRECSFSFVPFSLSLSLFSPCFICIMAFQLLLLALSSPAVSFTHSRTASNFHCNPERSLGFIRVQHDGHGRSHGGIRARSSVHPRAIDPTHSICPTDSPQMKNEVSL